MEASQQTALRTQLLILMIFLIILGYGTANEDEPQVQDLSWALGNPKAAVAMIPDERLRRGRDLGLNNPNECYPDEYYSEYYRRCMGCTRCSPGTQHDPQLPCGDGQGQEAHCIPCQDGYYQSREGLPILTCQPCMICDQHAIVESSCTQRSNTVCGKCQTGWYYREDNVCEECSEADIADSFNKDCYQEPEPTPGPKPTAGSGLAPGTQSHTDSLFQPGPSTTQPVPNVPGKVVEPPPQNTLDTWKILLIAGSVVAACVFVGVVGVKKNKKKDVPQLPADMHEMEHLYVENDGRPKEREQSSSSSGEVSGPLHDLVPPSSQLNSSRNGSRSSNSSKGHPQDHTSDQDEVSPVKNFVTRETEDQQDTDPQLSSHDGPLSDFNSLKSFEEIADGTRSQVPNMPAEGSQSSTERLKYSSKVSNKDDPVGNYDVAKGSSFMSGFRSLSSSPRDNNPRQV